MSEPKLISPLLDGFAMGSPMSDHDGVRCCPAMKENSDNKYIVKIISVPASQVQLDALLLTGAYQDPAEAMDYFKDISDGIIKEAEFLNKLAKLEGFLPYEGWQSVPMDNNDLGYDVYLYSPYKQSLEKYMRKNLMTHLGVVNLGLDMCAALAICRRAGRLYVDLKPSNIFISEDKEYRIGDLGFVELSGLKYATLPSKYRSAYTAPELLDPMNTLNTTADLFSIGMILYQIFNNGQLPYEGFATAEVYPAPENADYEICEIIMKAVAPDPKDRWQNPIEMGKALVAYMQRNTVNDVPITPPALVVTDDIEPVGKAGAAEEPETDEFGFMDGIVTDETAPGEEDTEGAEDRPLSDEATSMLAQAEDLLAHEVPGGVVVPEDVEVPVPTAPADESESDDETDDDTEDVEDEGTPVIGDPDTDDDLDDEEEEAQEEDDDEDEEEAPRKKKGWIAALIIGLVLALLAAGGFVFYKYYYQLPINELHVDPFEDQVTVTVDTDVDMTLLSVVCTDIYGNVQRQALTNGEAVFEELLPDTQYKIHLEAEGFHALVGSTSSMFSTPAVTEILDFSAATGNEDGSVVLTFGVNGPGTDEWNISYGPKGGEKEQFPFTGDQVTITGLTVGETYEFTLEPATELFMAGENTLTFTASAIVLAEDLKITDYSSASLTAQWSAPAESAPESWIVRCYNDAGYSETVETTETTITFSGIDTATAYTVEVTAAGMTQSVKAHVTANPTTVTGFHVDDSVQGKLVITWEYEGTYPEGGWLLLYTVDGVEKSMVITCEGARAEIDPCVPGASYSFELQAASGASVFNGEYSLDCPDATMFRDFSIMVDRSNYYLCKTPEDPDWEYSDVKKDEYTTEFAPGEKVSIIMKTAKHFIPRETVNILYAIRDVDGNVLAEFSASENVNWYQMWVNTYPYGTMDVPMVPEEPGTYQLCLYFNHQYVTVIEFTITE